MRANETPKITVAVRKRPLNKKELGRGQTDIVRVGSLGQVIISEYKQKVDLTRYLEQTTFNFDYAYDEKTNNEQIYEQAVRPLIENAFKGAKISCFAYGQTGSGKTYTMKGDISKGVPGIYYLGAKEIFRYLEQPQHRSMQIVVTFFEIYCGKLFDLLNNRNLLQIREDKKGNINVIGLNEKMICSAEEFLDVIEEGSVLRVTSQNNSNDDSSRSHAILQISIKEKKNTFSKISFIDLAGNERGADHMDMNKQTKIDGAEINKSLLTLKECIRALDQGKSHTPFRGSKLTMVLKDSFVGYCNTVMICNISPNTSSSENTMNTLRYADRVKQLKSRDQGERVPREEMLSRELMLPRANNKTVKVNIERGDDEQDIMMKMNMARAAQQNNEPYNRCFEEKMEIEEPTNSLPFSQFARKTQNVTNDVKLFANNDRRLTGKEVGTRSKPNFNEGQFKGRDFHAQNDKQPLLSRNVLSQKIDQNNLNLSNGGYNNDHKGPKLFTQNNNQTSNSLALNRNHFDAMNQLRSGFNQYREDHEELINRQMNLMKGELSLKEDYRQIENRGCSYEEEVDNVNLYLKEMERILREKEQIFTRMKGNFERMRAQAKNAQNATVNLRQQQAQQSRSTPLFGNGGSQFGQINARSFNRLHVHSSMNGMHFNGFNGNQFGDEQLLEGLGDESGNRLF